MGCGASSANTASGSQAPTRVQPAPENAEVSLPVGQAPSKLPPIASSTAANAPPEIEDAKEAKSGVAFSVSVDPNGQQAANDIDKILRRPLPPRLRHLAPLENAPSISPEQVAEKLKRAEEKRTRMLEKRRNSKVTKKSRARRELLKAQEFSTDNDATAATSAAAADGSTATDPNDPLQQKLAAAELKRQQQLEAVQQKQRLRAERAQAARERARLIREESELHIERDEGGDSDTDSWLGDENHTKQQQQQKKQQQQQLKQLQLEGEQQRDSSGYSSRDVSGSGDRSGTDFGSRATTGKTVSTVLEDDNDHDFFD